MKTFYIAANDILWGCKVYEVNTYSLALAKAHVAEKHPGFRIYETTKPVDYDLEMEWR